MLDLISRAGPQLCRLTCVEGFAYEGSGHYTSSLFGCGSANRFEAAIVGHFATEYASLHQNKAFLTTDALQFMGISFVIRQNSWSLFSVTESATSWVLEYKTLVNFSSFGLLYMLTIAIDIVLLLASMAGAVEIMKLVLWPFMQDLFDPKGGRGTDERLFALDDYKAVLTCPLFRSIPIALLMLASQLISWMIVLPNSIIWTWTERRSGKLQAYLSTLRVWVVPLILTNISWNMFVHVGESLAYSITSRTYVTVYEVGAITCLVAYIQRNSIFAIGSTKYAVDGQRTTDATSFPSYFAFGNGFADLHDTRQTTPSEILTLVYGPLASIVAWSLVGNVTVAIVRLIYLQLRRSHSGIHLDHRAVFPHPTEEEGSLRVTSSSYKRLPIETLLDLPIRARSLIRSSYSMETNMREKQFLRPSRYVEHGIVMEHQKLRTRLGFFGTICFSKNVEEHIMPIPIDNHADGHRQQVVVRALGSEASHRRRILTPLR